MLKKLNRMWLASIRKAGKAQQTRNSKMLKAMLAKSRPAKKTASTSTSTSTSLARKTSSPAQHSTAPAPGKWSSSYSPANPLSAKRLRYWRYLPASAPAAAAGRPLLIMLHGCEQSAVDFAEASRMNRLAEDQGYVVLYPQQSLQAHAQRCWKWYDPPTQRGAGDIALIAQMVRETIASNAIDARRVYVCGISAGAAMAQILALTHPELIAAVGLHSAPAFGVSRSAMGGYGVMQHGGANTLAPIAKLLARHPDFPLMPAILITGDDDQIVRPVNQLQLVGQFIYLNHALELTPQPLVTKQFGRTSKAHPRKNSMQIRDFANGKMVLIRSIHIERLGHAWSGGDEKFRFNAKGPDAGKLMLAFFSRHRRAAGPTT